MKVLSNDFILYLKIRLTTVCRFFFLICSETYIFLSQYVHHRLYHVTKNNTFHTFKTWCTISPLAPSRGSQFNLRLTTLLFTLFHRTVKQLWTEINLGKLSEGWCTITIFQTVQIQTVWIASLLVDHIDVLRGKIMFKHYNN